MTSYPYRYRCLECGSTQLQRRVTYGKETFNGSHASHRYTCEYCRSRNNKRMDMKTGKVVQ